jgi:hypothetical protein
MSNSLTDRQVRRYQPYSDYPYLELNEAITVNLKRYGDQLRGAQVLDFGCGERPFELFFSDFDARTTTCIFNRIN